MSNPSPGFRDRPEHTITVRPLGRRVTVTSDGTTLASSERALALKEHTYPEVIYVPFADIDFSKLSASDTGTHCPFKGDASYWSVKGGASDAMWAYRHPFDEVAGIKDHGAFYPSRVQIEVA